MARVSTCTVLQASLLVIDPLFQMSILFPEYAMHMSASVSSLMSGLLMECLFLSLPNESYIYSSSSNASFSSSVKLNLIILALCEVPFCTIYCAYH